VVPTWKKFEKHCSRPHGHRYQQWQQYTQKLIRQSFEEQTENTEIKNSSTQTEGAAVPPALLRGQTVTECLKNKHQQKYTKNCKSRCGIQRA
jgi:hypothetical protein